MSWRYYPLLPFLKVSMWIDASLLGYMAANCLSFPESIVSDYSVLDHWNVIRRLPEFLSAGSFITANATVIAKHWFCCFLSLIFCPLLWLLKSHSILLPLLCSSFVFPHSVGVIFSLRFSSASFIEIVEQCSRQRFLAITVKVSLWTNTVKFLFTVKVWSILDINVREVLNVEYHLNNKST